MRELEPQWQQKKATILAGNKKNQVGERLDNMSSRIDKGASSGIHETCEKFSCLREVARICNNTN